MILTSDPIGLAGGMNLFAYVGGDPVNGIDPWGLAQFTIYVRRSGPGSSGSSHDSGHGFIGVRYNDGTSEKRGFYPGGSITENGMVLHEGNTLYDAKLTFEVSDEQAKAAMDAMKKKKDERYWFYTNNCIDAVEDSIDGAGIKRPRQFGFPSNPDKLYDWIGGAK